MNFKNKQFFVFALAFVGIAFASAQIPEYHIETPSNGLKDERFEAVASPSIIPAINFDPYSNNGAPNNPLCLLIRHKSIHSVALGIKLKVPVPNAIIRLKDFSSGQVLQDIPIQNNPDDTLYFLSDFVQADSLMIEAVVPDKKQNGASNIATLSIFKIYITSNATARDDRFGISLPCHINASCETALPWADQRNGTCRIVMAHDEGLVYCSGTLMNNTLQDRTPYILTAFHCSNGLQPLYDLWRFDFQYYSKNCITGDTIPIPLTFHGAIPVAGRQESDFSLVRLKDTIPIWHPVYYHGWNYAMDTIPQQTVMLHHPRGDVMKFSRDTHPAELVRTIINWGEGVVTPPNHHWRVNWDEGTMEKGSSGAAMLDAHHRVVGQLNGGNANCETVYRSLFGRIAMSWSQGVTADSRLRDWLDPAQIDPIFWDGAFFEDTSRFSVTWQVKTPDSFPIAGLYKEGIFTPDTLYPIEIEPGTYRIQGLPRGKSLSFSTSFTDKPYNGVDNKDAQLLLDYILRQVPFDNHPLQFEAADIDRNGLINHSDLYFLLPRLQKKTGMSKLEKWIFFPNIITIQGIDQDIDLGIKWGIKPGDINFDRKISID